MRSGIRRASIAVAVWLASLGVGPFATSPQLKMYFIDVEGGQSTLIVTPAGQSLLIDAGFPGRDGTFESLPANPAEARDAQRIVTAARDAGVTQIDVLVTTHFHADHDGGVPELSQLIPIRTFVDHDTVPAEADVNVPGTLAAFARYAAVRARGQHVEAKPGDALPLRGVTVTVVSAAGVTLARPLRTAGASNPSCATTRLPPQERNENPRSNGIVLEFGRFRFVDLGDLTGPPLYALFCPNDRLGPADVYLLPHHGGLDAADTALFGARPPRVAVINNGPRKGGAPEMLRALAKSSGIEGVWQLHRSEAPGAVNVADAHVANLDTKTAFWIKIDANEDGSFTVTNGRTGATTTYATHR